MNMKKETITEVRPPFLLNTFRNLTALSFLLKMAYVKLFFKSKILVGARDLTVTVECQPLDILPLVFKTRRLRKKGNNSI